MSGWTLVIPVRGGAGKSRLDVPGVDRAELARAIGLDTIAAAQACPTVAQVVVVTADAEIAREIANDCLVVADPGSGLNAAVQAGLAVADAAAPRAAMLGDLPALDTTDLEAVLAAAGRHEMAALPDAEGTGTILITRTIAGELIPAFGENSFARHCAAGFVDLAREIDTGSGQPAVWSARRDVDTLDQLHEAEQLGLGIRSTALIQRSSGQGAASSVA
ncbi:MAG: 2-phospho-L-lactate guanylyltransferase [Micrococcales bacterium]|nr:2-phospho-L-lactate guanylyltransferase [Micrococcales bacterium]